MAQVYRAPNYTVPSSSFVATQQPVTAQVVPTPATTTTTTYTVAAPEGKEDGGNWGWGIVIGVIVLIVVILIIWWIVWATTQPSGRPDGDACTASSQCQGFCNGFGRCASGTGGTNGSPCRTTGDCEFSYECEKSNANVELGVCRPLLRR